MTKFNTNLINFKIIISIITIVYFFSAKGHMEIIDTEYSIRTAVTVIEKQSLLIDPPDLDAVINFPDNNHPTKIYSKYGIGLWIIYLPFVALGKLLAFITSNSDRIAIDFLISFVSPCFGITGLFFFKNIQKNLGISEINSNLSIVVLGLSTFYWKYSTTDFSEIIQACSILGIFYFLSKERITNFYGISFWLSFLISLKVIYVVFIPIFTIYIYLFTRRKNFKERLIYLFEYASFLFVTIITILIYNYLRFGDVFETGYGSEVNMFSFNYFIRDFIPYIFSYERGLLIFNPILLLSFIGVFFITSKKRSFFTLVVSICLTWYCLMCFWEDYFGDYSWGNRFLVPILPLLVLPISYAPTKVKTVKFISVMLISTSLSIQLVGSFTKIHEIKQIQEQISEHSNQFTPHQITTGLELIKNKLFDSKPIYLESDFGIISKEYIDLSHFNTFHGFNIWTVHLANHLGYNSFSYYIGLFVLLITTLLIIQIFRSTILPKY